MSKTVQQLWREACDEYTLQFCAKHGYTYEPDMWVANDPGTIIMIGDMFVDMRDIRYDIDHEIPEQKFEEWYWKNLELYELGVKNWLNYENYCKGAYDPYSERRVEELRKMKQNIEKLTNEFHETIQRYSASEQQGF